MCGWCVWPFALGYVAESVGGIGGAICEVIFDLL